MVVALLLSVAAQTWGPVVLDPPVVPVDATVAAPRDPPPTTRRVTRSLATTAWPVEPALLAGFWTSRDGVAPFLGATAFVPLAFSAGPVVAGRVSGVGVGRLGVLESVVGVGLGWQGRLGDARARATLLPAVLVSGWRYDSDRDGLDGGGVTFGPAVTLPLEVALPLGGGSSFTLALEPGLSRGITHVVDSEVAFARDRFFVMLGVGLDVGGPLD